MVNSSHREVLDQRGLAPEFAEVAHGSVSLGSPEVADSARQSVLHGMNLALLTSSVLAPLALVLTLAFLQTRPASTALETREPEL